MVAVSAPAGVPGAPPPPPTGAPASGGLNAPPNLVQPSQHGFVVVIDLVTPYQGNAVLAMKWVKDTYI
jgi:hypothetical protein